MLTHNREQRGRVGGENDVRLSRHRPFHTNHFTQILLIVVEASINQWLHSVIQSNQPCERFLVPFSARL